MEIVQLDSSGEIHWECVAQHHEAPGQLTKTDEWKGTLVIFLLKELSAISALLKFTHIGLTPNLECYDICDQGWTHFITVSLKKYLEHGEGEPYRDTSESGKIEN